MAPRRSTVQKPKKKQPQKQLVHNKEGKTGFKTGYRFLDAENSTAEVATTPTEYESVWPFETTPNPDFGGRGLSTEKPTDCCFSLMAGWLTLGIFVFICCSLMSVCCCCFRMIQKQEKEKCREVLEEFEEEHRKHCSIPRLDSHFMPIPGESLKRIPTVVTPQVKMDQLVELEKQPAHVTTDGKCLAGFLDYLARNPFDSKILNRPPRSNAILTQKDYRNTPAAVQKLVKQQLEHESGESMKEKKPEKKMLGKKSFQEQPRRPPKMQESTLAASELKMDPSLVFTELESDDRKNLNRTRSAPRKIKKRSRFSKKEKPKTEKETRKDSKTKKKGKRSTRK